MLALVYLGLWLGGEATPRFAIDGAFQSLTYLGDRTPTTESDESAAELAPYRDGALVVAHYAGASEWERHRA